MIKIIIINNNVDVEDDCLVGYASQDCDLSVAGHKRCFLTLESTIKDKNNSLFLSNSLDFA